MDLAGPFYNGISVKADSLYLIPEATNREPFSLIGVAPHARRATAAARQNADPGTTFSIALGRTPPATVLANYLEYTTEATETARNT
jgi:hypothetical protein